MHDLDEQLTNSEIKTLISLLIIDRIEASIPGVQAIELNAERCCDDSTG